MVANILYTVKWSLYASNQKTSDKTREMTKDLTATKVVKRKVGRPSGSVNRRGGGSPENTVGRDILIDVACGLLKTTQPAAITRALVARESGVDPSLIRYYFRNRSALLAAAARRITEYYQQMLEEASARSDGSPVSQLRGRVRALIDLLAEYPYFHRLITEDIMPSREPEAREMFSGVTARGTTSYDAILAVGIEQGVFDPAADSTFLLIATIAMAEFYTSGLWIIREVEGPPASELELRARYTDFVCNLILNGIVRR